MKKGFTLVELSIVLVIIGLLVGGILIGQSLIDSASLQSQVRQFQQLDAAVASFQSRYRAIPGDAALSYPRRTYGADTSLHPTKDGILTDDNRSMDTFHMRSTGFDEPALFWMDLAVLTKFTPDNCKDLADRVPDVDPEGAYIDGDTCTTGQAEYGSDVAIIPYAFDTSGGVPYVSNTDGNAYYMYDCSAVVAHHINANCVGVYTHLQALSFDSKVDDGIIDQGEVIAGEKNPGGNIRVNGGIINPGAYDVDAPELLVLVRKFGSK